MSKASRMHHSDEFGKPASGVISRSNALSFFSRRSIGAPSTITLDAITERESGVTPPPPPFTMKALVIGLVVVFVMGTTLLVLLMQFGPQFTPNLVP